MSEPSRQVIELMEVQQQSYANALSIIHEYREAAKAVVEAYEYDKDDFAFYMSRTMMDAIDKLKETL